jgi:hypothetical protein
MRHYWLVLVCLAGCSPYSYPKEVAAISTGVDQVSAAVASGYAGLAADRAAQAQLDLTQARAKVVMAPSCGVPVGATAESRLPCTLYRFGGSAPALSPVEETRDQTMATVAVLKDYADALAAVTNAADRAAYDAAVAQLSGAVGELAKSADVAAPGASVVAPAGVNVIGWVFGTALDQQRFDSLKAAVNAVGTKQANGVKPIHSVVTTLGIGLETLSDARRMVLFEETDALVSGLGPSLSDTAYRQQLSNAQAEIAVLDALRGANPTETTTALETAHDALVAAVNDPSRSYPSLVKAVNDFKNKAAALQAAFAATAVPQKPGAK